LQLEELDDVRGVQRGRTLRHDDGICRIAGARRVDADDDADLLTVLESSSVHKREERAADDLEREGRLS